jgi:hypothetical protein
MKRLLQSLAALCVAFGLSGCCCFVPACADPCGGGMYGGGWMPCRLPNPFAIFCCDWWGCGGGWGCGGWGGGGWGGGDCGCYGGPAQGWGDYGYAAPMVGSYSGAPMTMHAGNTYVPSAFPSVPAGIYCDDAEAAESAPMPAPANGDSTSTIIYQPQRPGAHRAHGPMQDARNQTWVPARF